MSVRKFDQKYLKKMFIFFI